MSKLINFEETWLVNTNLTKEDFYKSPILRFKFRLCLLNFSTYLVLLYDSLRSNASISLSDVARFTLDISNFEAEL